MKKQDLYENGEMAPAVSGTLHAEQIAKIACSDIAPQPATTLDEMVMTVGNTKEPPQESDPQTVDSSILENLVALGVVVLTATGLILAARGGNYAVVRTNLQAAGKTNKKTRMPKEQKVLRRRKRRK